LQDAPLWGIRADWPVALAVIDPPDRLKSDLPLNFHPFENRSPLVCGPPRTFYRPWREFSGVDQGDRLVMSPDFASVIGLCCRSRCLAFLVAATTPRLQRFGRICKRQEPVAGQGLDHVKELAKGSRHCASSGGEDSVDFETQALGDDRQAFRTAFLSKLEPDDPQQPLGAGACPPPAS